VFVTDDSVMIAFDELCRIAW